MHVMWHLFKRTQFCVFKCLSMLSPTLAKCLAEDSVVAQFLSTQGKRYVLITLYIFSSREVISAVLQFKCLSRVSLKSGNVRHLVNRFNQQVMHAGMGHGHDRKYNVLHLLKCLFNKSSVYFFIFVSIASGRKRCPLH